MITLKKNNYKILLPTISIGITISVLYIIYNYFSTNISRATGIFSNINDTGTLLMVSLIFVISYFEFLKNKYRYLMLIPGILGSLAILLTLSRGSFIGLIAGLTTYSLRSKKHIVVFVIIILLMSTVIYSNPKLNNRFFDSITIRENMDRIYIWLSSVEMIKDYPIKGVGPGNFPIIYPLYKHDYDQKTHTMSYAHNIFLNIAVETGLIGFILFSAIIIIILIMAIKIYNKNALSRGVVAAFLSVLIHNQFDCTILKFEIGVVFWILTGLIIAICFSDKNHKVT
ncbi:MAG: O-antigen ligase family protein [Halanaerobiales bacterium]|nr:O-antigen ligase family protein [Halanaerobiales bacterium]